MLRKSDFYRDPATLTVKRAGSNHVEYDPRRDDASTARRQPNPSAAGSLAVAPRLPPEQPFARFWVPSLVPREQFEATAPESFSCALCSDPALPFTVLTPCGHCTCQPCAEDSTRCPQCEKPIVARTVVHQLEGCVLSSLTFECKTRRCTFRSSDPHEAFHHRCDSAAAAPPHGVGVATSSARTPSAQPAAPPSVPWTGSATSQHLGDMALPVRSNSINSTSAEHRNAPPHALDATGMVVVAATANLDHCQSSTNATPAPRPAMPFVPQPTPLMLPSDANRRTKARRTLLFWDYDSMRPEFYGINARTFFRRLLGCLVTNCGVSSEVQSIVYVPDDAPPGATDGLVEMGAFVRNFPVYGLDDEGVAQAAASTLQVDLRQVIQSSVRDASITFTMYDVVLVTASLRVLAMYRSSIQDWLARTRESPFFLHFVSDLTALPSAGKAEAMAGAATYVDVVDFLKDSTGNERSRSHPSWDYV